MNVNGFLCAALLLVSGSAVSAAEIDLTTGPQRERQAVKFEESKYIKGKGFLIRNGESGRLLFSGLAIEAEKSGLIEVSSSGECKMAKLYFAGADGAFSESASCLGTFDADSILFDLAQNRQWKGKITQIRIDLVPAGKEDVLLKKIDILPPSDKIRLTSPWKKQTLLAPGEETSGIVEIRQPGSVFWSSKSDILPDGTVLVKDIYGKTLIEQKMKSGAVREGEFPFHPHAAYCELKLKNTGTAPVSFTMAFYQKKRSDSEAGIRNVPAETDENTVWIPEVKVSGEGRLQLFLEGENTLLTAADLPYAGPGTQLPSVYFRHLTPGTYRLTAKLNGLDCGGPVRVIRHTRKSPLNLPDVKTNLSGPRPEYILNGTEHLGTMEYLTNDPPVKPDQLIYLRRAADVFPVIAVRLIFRFHPDGSFDFRELDETLQNVLMHRPDKAVFIHVSVTDPGFRWRENHPEEGIGDENGNFQIKNYRDTPEATSSMASERWLADSRKCLKLLVEHLNRIPAGERVIGIMPCSGITWEWLHWGSARGVMTDYSEHYRRYFIGFLRKRYADIAALNRKWKTEYKDFDEVRVPTPERRKQSTGSDLRLPDGYQAEIDFAESLAALVESIPDNLCKTVKEASDGRLLTGAYYGYTNYITDPFRAHNTGHFRLTAFLRSPWTDILMAPSRYAGRELGGGGGFMMPEASVRLHNKLLISECDIRPVNSENPNGRVDTVLGSRAVFEREYAMQLAGYGIMRWFEFGKGWVTDDPRLLDVARKIAGIERSFQAKTGPCLPPSAFAAVFSSEKTAAYLAPDSRLNVMLLEHGYRNLIRSGIGFRMYDIADLKAVSADYRLFLFLNILHADPDTAGQILSLAEQPGRYLFFACGTGVIGENGLDLSLAEKLFRCGFRIETERKIHTVRFTKEAEELLGIPEGTEWSTPFPSGPSFYPESGVIPLAKTEDGQTALAWYERNGSTLLWASFPVFPAELFSALAARAKLPVIRTVRGNAAVWMGERILSAHTAKGAEISVILPEDRKGVRNLVTGEFYPADKGEILLTLPPSSTWMAVPE